MFFGLRQRFYIKNGENKRGKYKNCTEWNNNNLKTTNIMNVCCFFQDQCALNCMEKYLKMNQRISQRFQEFQILANENAMAMVQKAQK